MDKNENNFSIVVAQIIIVARRTYDTCCQPEELGYRYYEASVGCEIDVSRVRVVSINIPNSIEITFIRLSVASLL
jgi:hypothetical protein